MGETIKANTKIKIKWELISHSGRKIPEKHTCPRYFAYKASKQYLAMVHFQGVLISFLNNGSNCINSLKFTEHWSDREF